MTGEELFEDIAADILSTPGLPRRVVERFLARNRAALVTKFQELLDARGKRFVGYTYAPRNLDLRGTETIEVLIGRLGLLRKVRLPERLRAEQSLAYLEGSDQALYGEDYRDFLMRPPADVTMTQNEPGMKRRRAGRSGTSERLPIFDPVPGDELAEGIYFDDRYRLLEEFLDRTTGVLISRGATGKAVGELYGEIELELDEVLRAPYQEDLRGYVDRIYVPADILKPVD